MDVAQSSDFGSFQSPFYYLMTCIDRHPKLKDEHIGKRYVTHFLHRWVLVTLDNIEIATCSPPTEPSVNKGYKFDVDGE